MQQQDVNERRLFLHKELIHIYHVNQQIYLTDTNLDSKQGIIVTAQSEQNPNTIFILEKYCPTFSLYKSPNYTNTEIIQGDLLRIKSFSSNFYLTCFSDQKSKVTKQGLIELHKINETKFGRGEQVFILQNDPQNSDAIRLVNVGTGWALHSHKDLYPQMKDHHEVTGFQDRDTNDLWKIDFISAAIRDEIHQDFIPQPLPRNYQNIRSQDKINIRNAFTGGSLHSHKINYKYGQPSQEVTWFKLPRDENDWWQIFKIQGDQKQEQTQKIENNSVVSFLHVNTKLLLTHFPDRKVKAVDYFQVSCAKESFEEFKIELIETDQGINNLVTEKPFRILHIPTQQFLAVLERPSSQTKHQGEVVLTPDYDWRAIWMIDIVDSIFG